MNIISHRGYWQKVEERNQLIAFERSFKLNFGTETDIRDYKGELVISHDIADKNALPVKELFKLYNCINNKLPLALNIKADGLQIKLKSLLEKYNITNYFIFDMAVPDGILYVRDNFKVYTRQSEYEKIPSYYDGAIGIWLDEFDGHWITKEIINEHYSLGKSICIVSPDLHKKDDYKNIWMHYKKIENELGISDLCLCTDHPEEARLFYK